MDSKSTFADTSTYLGYFVKIRYNDIAEENKNYRFENYDT